MCSSSIHSAFLSPSPFASPSSLLLPPHSQRTHITVQHSSSAHDRPSRHYQNRRNAKYNLSYLTLAKTYSFGGFYSRILSGTLGNSPPPLQLFSKTRAQYCVLTFRDTHTTAGNEPTSTVLWRPLNETLGFRPSVDELPF